MYTQRENSFQVSIFTFLGSQLDYNSLNYFKNTKNHIKSYSTTKPPTILDFSIKNSPLTIYAYFVISHLYYLIYSSFNAINAAQMVDRMKFVRIETGKLQEKGGITIVQI